MARLRLIGGPLDGQTLTVNDRLASLPIVKFYSPRSRFVMPTSVESYEQRGRNEYRFHVRSEPIIEPGQQPTGPQPHQQGEGNG